MIKNLGNKRIRTYTPSQNIATATRNGWAYVIEHPTLKAVRIPTSVLGKTVEKNGGQVLNIYNEIPAPVDTSEYTFTALADRPVFEEGHEVTSFDVEVTEVGQSVQVNLTMADDSIAHFIADGEVQSGSSCNFSFDTTGTYTIEMVAQPSFAGVTYFSASGSAGVDLATLDLTLFSDLGEVRFEPQLDSSGSVNWMGTTQPGWLPASVRTYSDNGSKSFSFRSSTAPGVGVDVGTLNDGMELIDGWLLAGDPNELPDSVQDVYCRDTAFDDVFVTSLPSALVRWIHAERSRSNLDYSVFTAANVPYLEVLQAGSQNSYRGQIADIFADPPASLRAVRSESSSARQDLSRATIPSTLEILDLNGTRIATTENPVGGQPPLNDGGVPQDFSQASSLTFLRVVESEQNQDGSEKNIPDMWGLIDGLWAQTPSGGAASYNLADGLDVRIPEDTVPTLDRHPNGPTTATDRIQDIVNDAAAANKGISIMYTDPSTGSDTTSSS